MDKLLIIGASGHGKVVADIAMKMNKWSEISFLDDNESLDSVMGCKVLGGTELVLRFIDEYDVFVGIGNNQIRKKIQDMLILNNVQLPILVHPTAIIATQVKIGQGTVIMAGTVINSCTEIGVGTIINTGVTIDHDNIIEEYVHISPGAHLAGNVRVGKESWLGIGSLISNNITLVENCNIGAGAVVIKNIDQKGTYIGVPVRRI